MKKWIGTPKSIKDYIGFVYIITHKPTGKYYIGKKLFWFKKTLKPLKGKKRKRRSLVESDWKTYTGSSNKLNEFIEGHNKNDFERKIIRLCETRFELSYYEMKEQIDSEALFDPKCFNELIRVRLHRRKNNEILEEERN